jgi:hypothetical protein
MELPRAPVKCNGDHGKSCACDQSPNFDISGRSARRSEERGDAHRDLVHGGCSSATVSTHAQHETRPLLDALNTDERGDGCGPWAGAHDPPSSPRRLGIRIARPHRCMGMRLRGYRSAVLPPQRRTQSGDCEPCSRVLGGVATSCFGIGLPAEGIVSCVRMCFPRDTLPAVCGCEVAGQQFCNYDAGSTGTCEPCGQVRGPMAMGCLMFDQSVQGHEPRAQGGGVASTRPRGLGIRACQRCLRAQAHQSAGACVVRAEDGYKSMGRCGWSRHWVTSSAQAKKRCPRVDPGVTEVSTDAASGMRAPPPKPAPSLRPNEAELASMPMAMPTSVDVRPDSAEPLPRPLPSQERRRS